MGHISSAPSTVGRLLHPRAAQLPADPRQGGGGAAGGGGSPVRGVPPETAGGAAAAPSAFLEESAPQNRTTAP